MLSLSTLDIIPLSPSCKAGSFKSRRACHALMVLDALLWRQTPPSLSSRRPHRTFIPISPSCTGRSCRWFRLRRALCAHGARCPSVASSRRHCCALAVHLGRLYRSRHRAEYAEPDRQVETRSLRSRFSMPFFSVRPPPLLCSRRPHRTFIPLSPSCRAIVQVETRSLCAHDSRCPVQHRTGRGTYGAHSLRIDGLLPS